MQWVKSGEKILQSRRSLAVVVGMKKTNDNVEPTKSRTKKQKNKKTYHSYAVTSSSITRTMYSRHTRPLDTRSNTINVSPANKKHKYFFKINVEE